MHATIKPATEHESDMESVDVLAGSLNKKLAIHRSVNALGYTLTHIPTGFAVRTRMVTYRDAENLMLRMEDAADWNFRSPRSKKWKAQMRDLWELVKDIPQHPLI